MVHRDTDGDQSNKDPTLNIPYRNIAFGVGFGASKSLLDHISDRGQSGSTNADVPPPDSQTRAAAPQPRPLIQSAHDIDIHFTEQWEKDDVRDCIIHELNWGSSDSRILYDTSIHPLLLWEAFLYPDSSEVSLSDAQRKAFSDIAWDCIELTLEKKSEMEKAKKQAEEAKAAEQATSPEGTGSPDEQPEDGSSLNRFTASTIEKASNLLSNTVIPGLGAATLWLGKPAIGKLQGG